MTTKRPTQIQVWLKKESSNWRYLVECARARDISVTALVQRIVDDALDSKLIDSILGDEKHLLERRPGEHRFREI